MDILMRIIIFKNSEAGLGVKYYELYKAEITEDECTFINMFLGFQHSFQ